MTTDEKMTNLLKQLKDAESKASPGDWEWHIQSGSISARDERGTQIAHCQSVPGTAMLHDMAQVRANAEFIVLLRNNIREIIAALEAK